MLDISPKDGVLPMEHQITHNRSRSPDLEIGEDSSGNRNPPIQGYSPVVPSHVLFLTERPRDEFEMSPSNISFMPEPKADTFNHLVTDFQQHFNSLQIPDSLVKCCLRQSLGNM